MREWSAAKQNLVQLRTLVGHDENSSYWINLLQAELEMAQNNYAQAIDLLQPKAKSLSAQPRAVHLMLAQARLSSQQPQQIRSAMDDLQLWISDHPQDAQAWHWLSTGIQAQGEMIRALSAQAESLAAQYDYSGAVDRLKAAQQQVSQKQQNGAMTNADQVEASIVDARLHVLQKLAREQALQR
jgi:predicted Zn-dependent protease